MDKETTKKKIKFFSKHKIPVHIVIKDTKWFYNGLVVKLMDDDVCIIDDRKLGHKHIFYDEVYSVREYDTIKEKEEDKDDSKRE